MTGETQATALLLKKRTGWLTGRPSGQGAKGMSLAASSPQERLHGFQLGLGLMGGQRGVSLGKQRTPGGGARGVKQAGFKPRHGWFTNSGSDTDRCPLHHDVGKIFLFCEQIIVLIGLFL